MTTFTDTQIYQPILSVVIPCFNSEKYLREALDSVVGYPNKNIYELIIVNDGSTSLGTIQLLQQLELEGYRIIHQENKGPAAARNTGVSHAKGEYILFLDSDNKIRHDYITIGIELLQSDAEIGVVYGNAYFFGDYTTPRFIAKPLDIYRMLHGNYIDMCSVIRKRMWSEVGGLDEARVLIGHEDWEFWIRVAKAGWKFRYVDNILFDYRNRFDSISADAGKENAYKEMLHHIQEKHWQEYAQAYSIIFNQYIDLIDQIRTYEFDKRNPLRSFVKFLYKKYIIN